ncbi:hypothetical protein [Natrarchaeobaculum sulfurireducens]|uniref:Uncharacterized protein n=1 Tax=Natrarchaeobaculum sulfurireducens TaxID=2044521 RepID=A0A346PQU5_9EURY|nr:hypothetical protein [Natrarchaeobaculum sulfurireducens]AXR78121.1 hypothetical protein AArc1_1797 [Natrarchaeobaculum sulfurireducens]AXR81890.1 hypothetical protein AArcMg_1883 [Natrarchaeobaculum sulfurireducens]
MSHRSRRTVITAGGVAILGITAGCLDDADTQSPEPDTDSSDSTDADEPTDTDDDSSEADDEPVTVEEDPRIDEPPHEIERPEVPDDPDEDEEWNDDYLGEHIEPEPSLEFDVLDGVRLADPTLDEPMADISSDGDDTLESPENESGDGSEPADPDSEDDRVEPGGAEVEPGDGEMEYHVRLLESETALTDVIDLETTDDKDAETLEAIDFAETAVVVVESGWGSSSVHHRWARIEGDEDTIHLHGYYTDPHFGTMDYTTRHSVIVVERPADLEFARASITVSEDYRVHVNSTEGVVSLEADD